MESRTQGALILGIPVVTILYLIWLVLQRHMPDHIHHFYGLDYRIDAEGILYVFINTMVGRLILMSIVGVIVSWICVFLLVRKVSLIIWNGQKMKEGYLLFTTPEPASKILASKLLAILPLLLLIGAVNTLFISAFAWWALVSTGYMVIMFGIFSGVIAKTVPEGKWYKGWLSMLWWLAGSAVFAIMAFPSVIARLGLPVHLVRPVHFGHQALLLLALSTAIFFTSAYLLENKLEIWE